MKRFVILSIWACLSFSCTIMFPEEGELNQSCTAGGACASGLECVDGICRLSNEGDFDDEPDTSSELDTDLSTELDSDFASDTTTDEEEDTEDQETTDTSEEDESIEEDEESCTSHASEKCDSGDLYWYDSCGNREEKKEDCGEYGCTSGVCNTYPPFSCSNGICFDPITNLEWQQEPSEDSMKWDSAITFCQNLDLEGKYWRLPNISELRSLVRHCPTIELDADCAVKDESKACGYESNEICLHSENCYDTATCNPDSCSDEGGPTGCYWPDQLNGTCGWFWSSSGVENVDNHAWKVFFLQGGIGFGSNNYNGGVRCVRSIPRFVNITAGTFWMGSPNGDCPEEYPGNCINEPGRNADEEVLHQVTLTYDFEMMNHEVTQDEWEEAFGNHPSFHDESGDGYTCGGNCPVERVNWFDAVSYANWLSEQIGFTPCYLLSDCTGALGGGCDASATFCTEGTYECTVSLNNIDKPQDCEGYRLPTEAEWEYAIRAGEQYTALYSSEGNDGTLSYTDCTLDNNLAKIAWYCGNNIPNGPKPVERKAPNAWGLYDMSGNVFEWIGDWYEASYETGEPTNPWGPTTGSSRVIRGGGCLYDAWLCRSAYRGDMAPTSQNSGLGFRLVRTLPNNEIPEK